MTTTTSEHVALVYAARAKGAGGRVHRATCKHTPKTATIIPAEDVDADTLTAATRATCCSPRAFDVRATLAAVAEAKAAEAKATRKRRRTAARGASRPAAYVAPAGSVPRFIARALAALGEAHPGRAAEGFTVREVQQSGVAYDGDVPFPSVGAICASLDRGGNGYADTTVQGRRGIVAEA